jgi:hypothetical protein
LRASIHDLEAGRACGARVPYLEICGPSLQVCLLSGAEHTRG